MCMKWTDWCAVRTVPIRFHRSGETHWSRPASQRRMPSKATCASNVCYREPSSPTMTSRTDCDGQLPVKQEGAGAPNLAEQLCRQRTDLQQADGRLQSHAPTQDQLSEQTRRFDMPSTARTEPRPTGQYYARQQRRPVDNRVSDVSSSRAIRFEAYSKCATTSSCRRPSSVTTRRT